MCVRRHAARLQARLVAEAEERVRQEERTKLLASPAIASDILQRHLPPDLLEQSININRVTLEEQIGRGGFGTVWRASYDGARVAIKQPHQPDSLSEILRFRREIATMAELRHPYVVHYLGVVVKPCLLLVMELMHTPLSKLLEENAQLDKRLVCACA